jgi:hypothetical protein
MTDDLGRQIKAFVEHSNSAIYHESIDNLTPADVCGNGGDDPSRANASSVPPSQTDACSIGYRPLKL